MERIIAALMLASLPACGNSTTQDNGEISCDQVESAFVQFVGMHQHCTEDHECTFVGGTGTCECAPSLGNPDGIAIRKDAVDQAQVYIDFYLSEECDYLDRLEVCDAGGYYGAHCGNGICAAEGIYVCHPW